MWRAGTTTETMGWDAQPAMCLADASNPRKYITSVHGALARDRGPGDRIGHDTCAIDPSRLRQLQDKRGQRLLTLGTRIAEDGRRVDHAGGYLTASADRASRSTDASTNGHVASTGECLHGLIRVENHYNLSEVCANLETPSDTCG